MEFSTPYRVQVTREILDHLVEAGLAEPEDSALGTAIPGDPIDNLIEMLSDTLVVSVGVLPPIGGMAQDGIHTLILGMGFKETGLYRAQGCEALGKVPLIENEGWVGGVTWTSERIGRTLDIERLSLVTIDAMMGDFLDWHSQAGPCRVVQP